MTLQQMKYALTIAEQGSMNKAAEQLFILAAVAYKRGQGA